MILLASRPCCLDHILGTSFAQARKKYGEALIGAHTYLRHLNAHVRLSQEDVRGCARICLSHVTVALGVRPLVSSHGQVDGRLHRLLRRPRRRQRTERSAPNESLIRLQPRLEQFPNRLDYLTQNRRNHHCFSYDICICTSRP